MKIIIILTILLSINLYGEYKLSVKGGLNYSTAKIIEVDSNKVYNYGYKFGKIFFISFEKEISNDFYWNIDLGLNSKGYGGLYYNNYYSIELPIILGYSIAKSINTYIGLYSSIVFIEGDSFGGIMDNHGGKINNDYGFLIGIEYNYNNILFNFRFQQGYGNLKQSDPEGPTPYVTNNRQFSFMVGYQFSFKKRKKNDYVLRLNDIE